MEKISVIIPFYNVEKYISRCLKSVLNQSLKETEIILINDGSTDSTREIVQTFANSDLRIKIIDINERQGQGYARNRGIEAAKGEYIVFVDSDDFIENNMLELLYKSAKTNDTDITMCAADEYDNTDGKYINSDYYSLKVLEKFADKVFSPEDIKKEILDINVALWNKIYKREYLLSTGEKFPEGFIYEDLPFFFGTCLKAKRINIVWNILYHYGINRKNSTMKEFNAKILDRIPMVSLTYEKLKNTPYLNDMQKQIQGWVINDLFHRYILLKENYHKEFFFLMKKVFLNLDIENINDWYFKTVYHFKGYLLVINNTFENFCQKIFNEYLDFRELENRLHSEITNRFDIEKRLYKIENLFETPNEISKIKLQTEELKKNITEIKNLFENAKTPNDFKILYKDIKDLTYVLYDKNSRLEKELETLNERITSLETNFEQKLNQIREQIENREK